MAHILITGGAGFIGSYVNKLLNQLGYQTVVYDNLSKGDERTVVSGTFVKGDLSDQKTLDQLFSAYSFTDVIHLAGSIDTYESIKDPSRYYHNNVMNTLNVLDAMRRHQVNNLIFSSTAVLYSLEQEGKIKEERSFNPTTPYARSKFMCEQMIHDFSQAYGIRWVGLRYFNAAGGDPEGEIKNYKQTESNLIPIVLKSLLSGNKITIYGTDYPTRDGTCIRDYVHIHDLATAHVAAMDYLLEGGPSTQFNLGNGLGFSVKEVIAAVEAVTGQRVNVTEGPRRLGDSPFLIADASKAESILGWQAHYPELHTIIQHAWKALHERVCSASAL